MIESLLLTGKELIENITLKNTVYEATGSVAVKLNMTQLAMYIFKYLVSTTFRKTGKLCLCIWPKLTATYQSHFTVKVCESTGTLVISWHVLIHKYHANCTSFSG